MWIVGKLVTMFTNMFYSYINSVVCIDLKKKFVRNPKRDSYSW